MIVAIVNNNTVTQVVTVSDPSLDGGAGYQQVAQNAQAAIDITNLLPQPQVGWVFTGSVLQAPAGVLPATKITKLAFRDRFTPAELIGILEASATNPMLVVLQTNIDDSQYIDLSRAATAQGLGYLVSVGLLAPDRMTAILTAPPCANELYTG